MTNLIAGRKGLSGTMKAKDVANTFERYLMFGSQRGMDEPGHGSGNF
jgi:hypothetical protein